MRTRNTSPPVSYTHLPIELEQPTDTAIRAHSGLNSVILFGAGLAQLLAYLKHPLDLGAVVLLAQQADVYKRQIKPTVMATVLPERMEPSQMMPS